MDDNESTAPVVEASHVRAARDRFAMLAITIASGGAIAVVLYFAGAFSRSTG